MRAPNGTSTPTSDIAGLRRAVADDAPAVAAVTRAAYAAWVPSIGREPLPMRADHAAAIRDHRVDVVERAGQVVAVLETIVRSDDLLIVSLAVIPAWQRRRIGRTLLGVAEAHATRARRSVVRLYTNAAFAANIAYYQRRGYLIEDQRPLADGIAVYLAKTVNVA